MAKNTIINEAKASLPKGFILEESSVETVQGSVFDKAKASLPQGFVMEEPNVNFEPVPSDDVAANVKLGAEPLIPETVVDVPRKTSRIPQWDSVMNSIPDDLIESHGSGIKNAISLTSSYDMSLKQAFDMQSGFADKYGEPNLWDKAQGSFTAGIGDVSVGVGNTMKWLGYSEEEADMFTDYGERLKSAYIPPMDQSEFTWDKLQDPEFWATTGVGSVPFTLALIPASIAAAYGGAKVGARVALRYAMGKFGTKVLKTIGGSAAATMVSRPMESAFEAGGIYAEALAKDMTEEQAQAAANETFWNDMKLAGADIAQLLISFSPLRVSGNSMKKVTALRKAASSVGKVVKPVAKVGVVGVSEAGEERYQEFVGRRALKEEVSFFDFKDPRLNEASAIGAAFGVGLGGAGSVFTSLTNHVVNSMPEDVRKIYDEAKETAVKDDPRNAELQALDVVAETPEGEAHIQEAVEVLMVASENTTNIDKAPGLRDILDKATKGEVSEVAPQDVADTATDEAAIDLIMEGVDFENITDEMVEAKIAGAEPEVVSDDKTEFKDFDELSFIAMDTLENLGYTFKSASAQSNSLYFENKEGHLIRVSDHPVGISGSTLFATPDQSLEYKQMPTKDELIRDLGEATRDEFYKKTVERKESFKERERKRYREAVIRNKPKEDFYIEYLNKTNPGEYATATGRRRKQLRGKASKAWEAKTKTPEAIAEQFNLDYNGVQEFPGREPLHLFTLKDKGMESTITFESLDPKVVEAKIKEVRERFGVKEEPTRLITDEVYQAAKARVDEKLKGLKTGIDPTTIPDLAIMGAYYIETGLKTFSKWSGKMVEDYGDKIKPQLKAIWKDSNAYLKAQVPKKEVKAQVRQATGQTKAYKMIREDKALSASMKKAEQAARIAMREGKKEALAMERVRMKDIMAKARARVDETATVNKLKKAILKELKTTKVKKGAKGKFTADVQAVLDKFNKALKLTEAQAVDKIADNLEKYEGKAMPPEVATENKILFMSYKLQQTDKVTDKAISSPLRKRFDEAELTKILQEVKDLKNEGRMLSFLGKLDRSERDKAAVKTMVDVITGNKGLPKGLETVGVEPIKISPKDLKKWLVKFTNKLSVYFVGWNDLMDMLSANDKTSEPGQSRLSKLTEVHTAENAEKVGNSAATDKINEMALEAFGLKKPNELISQFNIDAKEMELGSFENADGIKVDLKMTKAEARKFMMEYADPSLRETFSLGMKYTDDMIATIKRTLTAQDRAFMGQQMNFYREYYNRVNEVYREEYGVDLPFNEFYTPIQREGVSATEGIYGEFLDEVAYRRKVSASSLKERVKNISRIGKRSDINVLEKHIAEMEHFIAWSERISELNAIFKNQDVRAAIKLHNGNTMLSVIDKAINDFTRGGIEISNRLDWLDKLRGNFTRSVLAIKPTISIKQFTSTAAYAEVMPIKDFTKGVAQFWLHPVENFKFLKENSVWFKERSIGTTSRDLKTAMKMREYSSFRKGRGFFNLLMLNVAIGDQGAIAVGGFAYYKYLVDKKGMAKAEAILEFEKFSEMTQQSSDLSIQSAWQRGGSIAKLSSSFLSSPNLYMRKELGAIRNLAAGRGSIKDHIKTIVIYQLVLPMLFQWVSDGFDWDEDEQKRAMIVGPLNGIFLVGDGIEFLVRKYLGLRTYDKQLSIYAGVDELGKFISEAVEAIAEGEMTDEEFFRATRGLAGGVGAFTGLPLKQVVDQSKTVKSLVDGEYEKALKGALGYSPYILDKKKDENEVYIVE